jgi:hypothetical protein
VHLKHPRFLQIVANIVTANSAVRKRNLFGVVSNVQFRELDHRMPNSQTVVYLLYRSAGKSLARPTSRCILFDGENTSFDASLVMYINSSNIPPIIIINRIYEHQNPPSL